MTDFSTSHPRAPSRGDKNPSADAPSINDAAPAPGIETGKPLRDLLAEQVELLRRLTSLGEAQRSHIESGDVDALLEVLKQRQTLIHQLVAADRVIASRMELRKRAGDVAADGEAGASADANADANTDATVVEELLSEAQELRRALVEQDERDGARLASMRNALGTDLQKLSNAGRAAASYQQRSAAAYVTAGGGGAAIGNLTRGIATGGGGGFATGGRFTDQKG